MTQRILLVATLCVLASLTTPRRTLKETTAARIRIRICSTTTTFRRSHARRIPAPLGHSFTSRRDPSRLGSVTPTSPTSRCCRTSFCTTTAAPTTAVMARTAG